MAATHQYDGTHKHIYPGDVTLGVDITKTSENQCTTDSKIIYDLQVYIHRAPCKMAFFKVDRFKYWSRRVCLTLEMIIYYCVH